MSPPLFKSELALIESVVIEPSLLSRVIVPAVVLIVAPTASNKLEKMEDVLISLAAESAIAPPSSVEPEFRVPAVVLMLPPLVVRVISPPSPLPDELELMSPVIMSPAALVRLISPPPENPLDSMLPVLMLLAALRVILPPAPVATVVRDLSEPAVVSIAPLLLVRVISPPSPSANGMVSMLPVLMLPLAERVTSPGLRLALPPGPASVEDRIATTGGGPGVVVSISPLLLVISISPPLSSPPEKMGPVVILPLAVRLTLPPSPETEPEPRMPAVVSMAPPLSRVISPP